MAKTETTKKVATTPILVVLASLILPGFGQFLSKKRTRGLLILTTTVVLAYLVNWSLVHQNIGKINLGTWITSWLWLPLILFWIWNVLDARAQLSQKTFSLLPGILFVSVVLYVIAYNVTDIKPKRLIERFGDARTVATFLINPDFITMNVGGVDKICAWSCMYTYIGDKLAGRPVTGPIRASDNLLQIIGSVKLVPASKWPVSLGLEAPGSKIKTFVAGSIIQTIAMGLMATLFSKILAIPISFFAARNIMARLPGGAAIY